MSHTSCVPCTVIGIKDIMVNKRHIILAFTELGLVQRIKIIMKTEFFKDCNNDMLN